MSTRYLAPLAAIATSLLASPVGATTAGPVTDLGIGPAMASQRAPSVTFDGTRYFIVWEDSRNLTMSGVDLFFARIGTNGVVEDVAALPLLSPPVAQNQTTPQAVYNSIAGTLVVAWADGRDADSNIWATRILPGSGTVLEQAGFQVSSATDPDAQPTVACAVQSCLFAWQAATGGASEIRARRFFPNAVPLDANAAVISSGPATTESKPRAIAIASTFFLTWEDDRNTATSGLDLFARTIGDFDPFVAVPGTPITTQNLRQTESDPAPLGPSGLVIVWQDQRNGILVDDIFGRTFDTALAPLSADALIGGAAEDQLRPRVAGDATRGLAVWQDRRAGAFGYTFGTRLDANGAVRDTDGFPLLPANANVFEHTVTKGPGADYLVAAVRFDGTPRIMYRIVRDEPPASAMTPTGTLQVPANGTTRAMLTFGPAKGATPPMYDVVDGTLYTVTLSRSDVTIDVPDQRPGTPGHQVPAISGAVSFGLSSLAHGSVTVSVASVEGTSTGQATVIFDNVPPVATNVVVGPAGTDSSEDLSLTYTYSDINSDPESGTSIEWTKNSAIQGAHANQLAVPASATRRGEQWRARVTPRDGLDNGAFVFSNTIVIGNTAPLALNVRIEPNSGVRTGSMLRGRYIFDDVDSDSPGPDTELRWYDRGVEVPALRGVSDIAGAMVVKGQVWRFEVLPHDGFNPGPIASSSTVTVENTEPVAEAGANGAVIERRRHTLDGTMSSDVDPQDVLTYQWSQIAGPTVQLSSTSSATPSFEAPSITGTTILQFRLLVNDGDDDSLNADTVTVEVSPVADTDADGLDDEEEMIAGTDPTRGDTDRDSLGDLQEVQAATDPLDEDSDDDGVRDGAEGRTCVDCPPAPTADSDGDTLIDALDPDSDNDGLTDGTELGVRTALMGTDIAAGNFTADDDGSTTTDPTRADTDMDGIADGVEDANHNGRVDPGESDPNDPTDPQVACTLGGNECPPGTECDGMFCRVPAGGDGGLTCQLLADRNIECCMGGCATGTPVEPVCRGQGQLEQCPTGAMQCQAGACSMNTPGPGPSSGCSCSNEGSRAGGVGALVLLAALLIARRRR